METRRWGTIETESGPAPTLGPTWCENIPARGRAAAGGGGGEAGEGLDTNCGKNWWHLSRNPLLSSPPPPATPAHSTLSLFATLNRFVKSSRSLHHSSLRPGLGWEAD